MTERMQTIPVKEFLENMGLMQYFDMFIIKGYDNEKDIVTLDEDDLDAMLISDPDHRHQILQAGEYERISHVYFGTKIYKFIIKYVSLILIWKVGFFLNFVLTGGQSRKIITKYMCIDKCVCLIINTVEWLYSACIV